MRKKYLVRTESLKEQVYRYLRDQIGQKNIQPGAVINMNAISLELGISKTPLRDALIQLESEGFVEIRPRRGVFVSRLGLDDIREIYLILGALESAALLVNGDRFKPDQLERMRQLNRQMKEALAEDDFERFYRHNLQFHQVYLHLGENKRLRRTVDNLKRRLYDFPRQPRWIKEWEEASVLEHDRLVEFLEKNDTRGAADFIRDVHWSFAVQERFIRRYYFPEPALAVSGSKN